MEAKGIYTTVRHENGGRERLRKGTPVNERDLFPCAGGVGLAGRVNGVLELSEMDEGGGESGKVGNVVEQKFGRFVHLLLVAPLANLTQGGRERRHTEATGFSLYVAQGAQFAPSTRTQIR